MAEHAEDFLAQRTVAGTAHGAAALELFAEKAQQFLLLVLQLPRDRPGEEEEVVADGVALEEYALEGL